MIFSIHVTESTINIVSVIAKAFGEKYPAMIAELRTESNIHGDETIWRMDGTNYWLWAFIGRGLIYEIDKSRAKVIPKRILKGFVATSQVTRMKHGTIWYHTPEIPH